jgi:hypothetical protein
MAEDLTPEERAALEKSIHDTEAKIAASDMYRYECRICGKTPQDIGWCDQCGYNRPYDKIKIVTQH